MCPIYMTFGMTYEQYWHGDPCAVIAYREAFKLKRRMENENMWLQGLYFCNALESVIGTAFGKKRIKYIQEPLDIYPKTKEEVEMENAEKKKKLIEYLNGMIKK